MLKTLNDKLKLMRATRVQCEELAMTMEFLEGGAIKQLKTHLKKYYEDDDNDTLRINVDNEVSALIELADKNRKDEDLLNKEGINPGDNDDEEEKRQDAKSNGSDSKFGYLAWLNKHVNLEECNDIVYEKKL